LDSHNYHYPFSIYIPVNPSLYMKFILNTTVILLLLPHKQKLIMSQAVLSLKNVTIYQEDNVILSNINLR
jgi:hypothetical protein